MNISSINSIHPPEPLTTEVLGGWYKKMLQDADLHEGYYSITVDGNAWRKACKMMNKRLMSKRARRLLRNRRKMK